MQVLNIPISKHREMISALQEGFGGDEAAAKGVIVTYCKLLNYDTANIAGSLQRLVEAVEPSQVTYMKKLVQRNPSLLAAKPQSLLVGVTRTTLTVPQFTTHPAAMAHRCLPLRH